jgi:malonyl CoA-acyl carrier protein transacylase
MTFSIASAKKGAGVGYLFPGQGAQSVGMGGELYDSSPAARSVFHEVDMALGRPLSKLVFTGPEDAEQIVISGDVMAVAQALDLAIARGAKKVIPLQVGGAFHSSLMEPARAGLIDAVSSLSFKDPAVPIVANCTGKPLKKGSEVKREIISQIITCVQWKRSMDYMLKRGVSQFVEIGPGRTLSSMVKRIDRSASAVSVDNVEAILNLRKN